MIFQPHGRRDDGDIRTTALFCGCNRDPIPMAQFSRGLLGIEANDTAFTHQRRNGVDAELRGFLERVVHALTARDSLGEGDGQRRSWQWHPRPADIQAESPITQRDQGRVMFFADTVENDDGGSRFEAQHAQQMECHPLVKGELGALHQWAGVVYANGAHTQSVPVESTRRRPSVPIKVSG